MKISRPTTADAVVLAFLQAEIDSPGFSQYVAQALTCAGLTAAADIAGKQDLTDRRKNSARRAALAAVRGFGVSGLLFQGFPADVRWYRAPVTLKGLAGFLYARHEVWSRLTAGTRLVGDGATNARSVATGEDTWGNVTGIAARIAAGEVLAPLIAGQDKPGRTVLIEGQTRATAYVSHGRPETMPVILGQSANLSQWHFY